MAFVQPTRCARNTFGVGLFVIATAVASSAAGDQTVDFQQLGREYDRETIAIVRQFCMDCHSTDEAEGELDLERFVTLDAVRRDPTTWTKVAEMLDNGEMPPKDSPQPSDAQSRRMRSWIEAYLNAEALASAGDPGPVILRRLSNMEYTYTARDLTGVATLDPVREFPVDGAAGEGFTNVGAGLVMSPALLTKYLDAAKEIANHAVLLPDRIRFSPHTSTRDWTDEVLAEIRQFYSKFSETTGTTPFDLPGVKNFELTAAGRLPVGAYLTALADQRDSLSAGTKSINDLAVADDLNAKYLGLLWKQLGEQNQSWLLESLGQKWKAGTLAADDIKQWQQSLWRFASVGHIGKRGGPKQWMEVVNPLAAQQHVRLKISAARADGDVTLYLLTDNAGDGSEGDFAIWENPRLVVPGRGDVALRDVQTVWRSIEDRRVTVIESAATCLAAAAEAVSLDGVVDTTTLANKHGVDAKVLTAWLRLLGISTTGPAQLGPLLTGKQTKVLDYDFVTSWHGENALSVTANSSDNDVNVPGDMRAHSVAVHPSPEKAAGIAWVSPLSGEVRVTGAVQDAHLSCGNGVTWELEVRRGQARKRMDGGVTDGGKRVKFEVLSGVHVEPGDAIVLLVGPRGGSHVCDHTFVELVIDDGTRQWDLDRDVSSDLLAGNPHDDNFGNEGVWHFFGERQTQGSISQIPDGSLLKMWHDASDPADRQKLAERISRLLKLGLATVGEDSANRVLYHRILSIDGPFFTDVFRPGGLLRQDDASLPFGLAPERFGRRPNGTAGKPVDLCVQAPSTIEIRLPGALVAGGEFVATARLEPETGFEGSVRMQATLSQPELPLAPPTIANPVLVNEGSDARKRFEAGMDDFRQLFPIAICYPDIVPVDEVVTLQIFYREDDHLKRLMLSDAQIAELDRLWEALLFVSDAPLKQVDVFEQLFQFSTQDGDPTQFAPLREPILKAAADYERRRLEVEPVHVREVLGFAERAWRRPLSKNERNQLRMLYGTLRRQELPHPAAIRMLLARILVAPAFLYRGEIARPGTRAAPVSDWELATRLSYFLWSSTPDDELRSLAAAEKLSQTATLISQTRRMLKDERARRLATEFGAAWLHVRDVATLDEKSERLFPTFPDVREAMQEETVRFFIDLFQNDRSVLSLLNADHTFVNSALAKHYGIDSDMMGWQRVDGMRSRGRGGILGFASTLAKHSGASRTSPILRGNWICEVVLGEKLPLPPKDVPVLPENVPEGLSERELIERHTGDPACARCHERIDPLGFSLEGFDAIGRAREKNASGEKIDTRAKLSNGAEFDGIEGLRNYLLEARRDDFLRQFCRKLLGYALGRSVQLSDEPLISEMLSELNGHDDRVGRVVDKIVGSRQFREVRGARELAGKAGSQR